MNVGSVEDWARRQGDGALNYILKLADIARPVEIHEQFHSCGSDGFHRRLCVTGKAFQKSTYECGNIFFVFPQWRNIYSNNIQTIIKIFAESAFLECRAQVTVSSCHQADIHF